MEKKKKARLEAAGWKVGSATEFLGLSRAEYDFSKGERARYAREPFAEIPARERWLYENPAALESVKRGLRQSGTGDTIPLRFSSRPARKRKK
jgi:hypothetical protein